MSNKNDAATLKEHMIFQKTHTTSLSDVRTLNMWGFRLENVDVLERCHNVETISLSLNNIATLRPFAGCNNLRCLFLRQNKIKDLSEIDYLVQLPYLRQLMLKDNPIASHPDYIPYILSKLPYLEKIDDVPVENFSLKGYKLSNEKTAGVAASQSALAFPEFGAQMKDEQRMSARQNPVRKSFGNQKRLLSNEDVSSDAWQPQPKRNEPSKLSRAPDTNMLAAVLALLPELSKDSLDIVQDAIKDMRS